jgi:drug/metabolite transporter (DMT)-like permease
MSRGGAALRVSRRQIASAGLAGLLILAGGIGLVTVAEQEVPSALAALVIASIPLWVVLLRVMDREDIRWTTLTGTLLGLGGLVVLLRPGESGGPSARGLALLICSAILTAIGAYFSRRMDMPSDSLVTTTIEMLVAGSVLLVAGLVGGELHDLSLDRVSGNSLAAFAYLVVIGSVVAYSAFVWLLDNARVSTVATYAYVNPVVAVILGVLVLDERVSATMAVGAVLIVAAVVIVVRAEEKAARVPSQ